MVNKSAKINYDEFFDYLFDQREKMTKKPIKVMKKVMYLKKFLLQQNFNNVTQNC